MAEKLSTGLRQYLLGEGSFRKAFEDAVLKIYSGTAPDSADDAETGTLLCSITKSGGTVSSGERSVPKIQHITIPDSHGLNATVILAVTVDGVGPTSYTWTNNPDEDAAPMMIKVARMLNDIPQLDCQPDVTLREIYVKSRIDGLDFTIADGGGSVTATIVAAAQAASRGDTLQLGAPAAGVIEKNSDSWYGTNVASGTAGYFRLVTSSDLGTDNATDLRLQGTVGVSGAEMIVSSVNFVSGAVTTISDFEYELPEE